MTEIWGLFITVVGSDHPGGPKRMLISFSPGFKTNSKMLLKSRVLLIKVGFENMAEVCSHELYNAVL